LIEQMQMSRHIGALKALCFVLVAASAANPFAARAQRQIDPAVAEVGTAFTSATVATNGTTLHYVRGGSGPALVLLHGFPQSWYEFRRIMPRLAKSFTVVAVDLRGVGNSAAASDGFDIATMAADVQGLIKELKLENPYLVGHDVGGNVAYALARLHPDATRGAMIIDVPLFGLDPWDDVKRDPKLWHVSFLATPRVPEILIPGREAAYFREAFFNLGTRDPRAITDADLTQYAKAYATADQLRASLGFYRAIPAGEKFNASQTSPITVPFVLAAGEHSFAPLLDKMAAAMRTNGAANVKTEVVAGGAHYLVDEQPDAVAALIERHARDNAPTGALPGR
jgi:pimeloyl-ACP methyl ester carboxylesterase